MDGVIDPLTIATDGTRWGVAAGGMVAWLPASMWAAAEALRDQMEAMNAACARLEMMIERAKEAAEDGEV